MYTKLNIKKLTHFDLMVIEKDFFEICLLKTMEIFTRENQRYYIWVCWKNGKGADDIHKELVSLKRYQNVLFIAGLKYSKLDNQASKMHLVLDVPAKLLRLRTLILLKTL